tara:strand:+ start:33 stop:629 length:597 start_codon:yes stop_codon:yes gene_type:complete
MGTKSYTATEFNAFEPKLAGLEGNVQAEPRVFAHDAVSIVVGAVNIENRGGYTDLINAGTGYAVGTLEATTAVPANGTGLTVEILSVNTGVITSFKIDAVGSGYSVGDVITITSGGGNATFEITSVDIPKTQRRGCCIYVGDITVGSTLNVTMESGSEAVFTGLTAGSFLPVLVKSVNVGAVAPGPTKTTAASLLALY